MVAIAAVLLALSSRTLGFFRKSKPATDVAGNRGSNQAAPAISQEIRYCRLPNGCKLAWSTAGSGYPIVRSLGWFTNLEAEWNSPDASQFWQKLAGRFQLVRYDGRGMGMSDRKVDEFNPDTRLEDLEAVIEASGLEKFALMGLSEGGPTAIRYAAKYPDRVSHLVIWGSFLVAPDPADLPEFISIARLVRKQWGSESGAFHQMFTAMFLPEGNAEQNKHFNEMQRTSATPDVAAAFMRGIGEVDVREIAADVHVPALILHRKGDLVAPAKYGQEMAAQLPNARLVLLDGSNHWMVSGDEDMDNIIGLIDEFVAE